MFKPDNAELSRAALAYRKRIGKHLMTLRKRKGLNQDEFAFNAGLHRSHVGKIENATLNVTLESLYKYAYGLEMNVWEMLRVESEGETQEPE